MQADDGGVDTEVKEDRVLIIYARGQSQMIG